jgi:hypothetical protein
MAASIGVPEEKISFELRLAKHPYSDSITDISVVEI